MLKLNASRIPKSLTDINQNLPASGLANYCYNKYSYGINDIPQHYIKSLQF